MAINTEQDLRNYFRTSLEEGIKKHKLKLSAFAEIYLLDLLERALDTKKIFTSEANSPIDEPLAIILGKAVESQDPYKKIQLLKNIGDRSLYVSGFFADSLNKKTIDIDYYISMGRGAYKFVADLSLAKSKPIGHADIFEELSEKFIHLVHLISFVSEQSGMTDTDNLIKLYDKWVHTNNESYSEKLRSKGIHLDIENKGKIH